MFWFLKKPKTVNSQLLKTEKTLDKEIHKKILLNKWYNLNISKYLDLN